MQVYFRYSNDDEREEFEICSKYFRTVRCRSELVEKWEYYLSDPETLVLPRFSALPFPRELSADLESYNLRLINPLYQQSLIHNMDWIYPLENVTPKTWFKLWEVPEEAFPVVIKGRINSRKFEWDSKMFAPTFRDAANISGELYHDPLISSQGVVYRQYIPLVTYEIGINGMPMTNEWRCFFYKGELLTYGYYWTTLDDQSVVSKEKFEKEGGLKFAEDNARLLYSKLNVDFFVLDVAEKEEGGWVVIEVNDGQMSGLSSIDPDEFYSKLKIVIEGK